MARSSNSIRWNLVLPLLGITWVAVALAAIAGQSESASIIGLVADESGAILPGVTVTAKSPSLQVSEVSAVTNEQGEYLGDERFIWVLIAVWTVKRQCIV